MNSYKGRLLIVDDEFELRELIELQLQPMVKATGCTIELAEDGADALAKVKLEPFDAIISDITMPKMSGLELLFQLREMGSDVPFVLLTGYGDKSKAVEALRLGAFDFLEKPWESEKLIETLTRALNHGIGLREIENELQRMATSEFLVDDTLLKPELERTKKTMEVVREQKKPKAG